jgi:competence ComEA-like helix-hairpin-helix protein
VERILFRKTLGCIIVCCAVAAAGPACVKLPRRIQTADTRMTLDSPTPEGRPLVSINRASPEELEKLPGIGPALAARIVEQRERYGPFRRAEHLMMVRGFSERRFRELRHFITVE